MITKGNNLADAIQKSISDMKDTLDVEDSILLERIKEATEKLKSKSELDIVEGSYTKDNYHTQQLIELKNTLEVVKDVIAPLSIKQELHHLEAIKRMVEESGDIPSNLDDES